MSGNTPIAVLLKHVVWFCALQKTWVSLIQPIKIFQTYLIKEFYILALAD